MIPGGNRRRPCPTPHPSGVEGMIGYWKGGGIG